MYAGNRFERVQKAIEQLGPADHVCTLYDQRDEEVAIAVSYIRAGLDRNELCVCVVDDGGTTILDALASEGIDTFRAQHLDLATREIMTETGAISVLVNDSESPLAWLARRKEIGRASCRERVSSVV